MDANHTPQWEYVKHDLSKEKPALEHRLTAEQANAGKSRIEALLENIGAYIAPDNAWGEGSIPNNISEHDVYNIVKKLNNEGNYKTVIDKWKVYARTTSNPDLKREIGWGYFKQGLMLKKQGMAMKEKGNKDQGDRLIDEAYKHFEQAHSIDSYFNALPDLRKAKYLGQKPPKDKIKEINGNETIITGYQIGDKWITIYSLLNKKIYGFGITDIKTKAKQSFWDCEYDSVFEQVGKKCKLFIPNYS